MNAARILIFAPVGCRSFSGVPTWVKNIRKFRAKLAPALKGTHDDFPGAAAIPIKALSAVQIKQLKAKLMAQPLAGMPGVVPRAYPVYCEDKDKAHLFVPRAFSPSLFEASRIDPKKVDGDEAGSLQFLGELKDEQKKAVDTAMASLEASGNCMLCMPCGSGKTVTALGIAGNLKKKTLVIVHKSFLLNQWKERIGHFLGNPKVGIIQGQSRPDNDCQIVIAMLQTVISPGFKDDALFKQFGLVIIDECHHISARHFSSLMWKVSPKYLLGLTATPIRRDGLTHILEHFMGPISFHLDRANAPLVEARIIKCAAINTEAGSDWTDYIRELTQNEERNAQIARVVLEESKDKQTLILSDRIDHLKRLEDILRQSGDSNTSIGFYIGGMKPSDLKKSQDCKIILGTYSMASEGLDIVGLSAVALATPRRTIEQPVGRVLRSAEALVLDFVDAKGASSDRLHYYREQGFNIRYQ